MSGTGHPLASRERHADESDGGREFAEHELGADASDGPPQGRAALEKKMAATCALRYPRLFSGKK